MLELMNIKKWAAFFVLVLMVAVFAAGCGSGTPAPAPTPEPPSPSAITHAIDGAYENCMGCHGPAIEASHADFAGYEDSCLDCHKPE